MKTFNKIVGAFLGLTLAGGVTAGVVAGTDLMVKADNTYSMQAYARVDIDNVTHYVKYDGSARAVLTETPSEAIYNITFSSSTELTMTTNGYNFGYASSTNLSNTATTWTLNSNNPGQVLVGNGTRTVGYRTSTYNQAKAYTTGNINGTEYYQVYFYTTEELNAWQNRCSSNVFAEECLTNLAYSGALSGQILPDITTGETPVELPEEVSVDGARDVIDGLSDNETTTQLYTLSNVYVTNVRYEWTAANGVSFDVAATADGTDTIYVFKAKVAQAIGEKVKAGAVISVTGNLEKYLNTKSSNYEYEMVNVTEIVIEQEAPTSAIFTLTGDNFTAADGATATSGYAKYNGSRTIEGYTITTTSVMINKSDLQFQKNAGTMTITREDGQTFTIELLDPSDTNLSKAYLTLSGNTITTGSKAGYCQIRLTLS